VRFVAFHIINPLIHGANFLLDKIGLKIPEIPAFATGGRVPGGWGGGDKVVAAVEPGEWVLTKKQARGIGYGNLAQLPRYAEGGPVGGGLGASLTGWNPISAVGDVVGSIGHGLSSAVHSLAHMGAEVWDEAKHLFRYAAAKAFEALTVPLKALAQNYAGQSVPPHLMQHTLGQVMLNAIQKTVDFIWGKSEHTPEAAAGVGAMAEQIVSIAAQQIGKPYVWGAHGPGSFDCSGLVEYAYRKAGYKGGQYGGVGTYTGDEVKHGWFVNQPYLPADLIFFGDKFAPHHVALSTGGTGLIEAPQPGHPVQRNSIYYSNGDVNVKRILKDTGTLNVGPSGGGAVTRWNDAVAKALQLNRQSSQSEFVNAVDYIMSRESSGNPRAINNTDINAAHGDPSRGLMQVIGSTFAANHVSGTSWDIYDPLANVAAAIRYMVGRYGGVMQALNYWQAHSYYDSGGLLPPGATLAVNHTRKPEPVLTSSQWDTMSAAASNPGGGLHHIVGGSMSIEPDSQGRLRAWVADVVLAEADYADTTARMGGGNW
jgi:SLT domain-containing protein/cell wall-associated NlpC family hydrolase